MDGQIVLQDKNWQTNVTLVYFKIDFFQSADSRVARTENTYHPFFFVFLCGVLYADC